MSKKVILFGVIAISLAAVFAACKKKEKEEDKIGKIHGSVVANGNPINAAAILLTPGGGTKITGSDGMYDFSDLQPGRYELKVFKEGFQSYNKSIDVVAGKDEELVITLTASVGNLSLNKAYIDMGSNGSNNAAGFSILNNGSAELSWSITNAAGWISQIDPQNGTIEANSAEAVTLTINRSRLSANNSDNFATLVVSGTDGSVAELLITVFGKGDGTNTTIGGDKDYVIIGDLYVQTKDIGGTMNWISAYNSCESSTVGGFDDWRLPDIGELGLLYSKEEAIGGFTSDVLYNSAYWSSNATTSDSYHYYIDFKTAKQDYSDGGAGTNSGSYPQKWRCRCRAVRKATPLPVVSTLPATNVTANAATLNGKIENKGEPAFTERGFVYSNTFQNPTVEDDASTTTKRVVTGTSTDFSANISGLTTETTYYVRAYAINNKGTAYGEVVSFKATAVVDYVVLQSDGIMVQKYDLSSGTDWNTAKNLCTNSRVGGYSDWRLPTKGELATLYDKRNTIGGFATSGSNSLYWSSTAINSSHWVQDFSSGAQNYYSGNSTNRCRCVRNY